MAYWFIETSHKIQSATKLCNINNFSDIPTPTFLLSN